MILKSLTDGVELSPRRKSLWESGQTLLPHCHQHSQLKKKNSYNREERTLQLFHNESFVSTIIRTFRICLSIVRKWSKILFCTKNELLMKVSIIIKFKDLYEPHKCKVDILRIDRLLCLFKVISKRATHRKYDNFFSSIF